MRVDAASVRAAAVAEEVWRLLVVQVAAAGQVRQRLALQ
jgi:hypothetical protein